MSPDRPETHSSQLVFPHQLGSPARHLLHQAEKESGTPVIVEQVPLDVQQTYARISYARGAAPHTISLAEEAAPFWDYLVAHECAHVLRLFAVPPTDRLVPATDKRREREVIRFLVPQIEQRWRQVAGVEAPPLPEAPHLAQVYHLGLVSKVINFPSDLRIETWIREEQAELRALQEVTLRTNIADINVSLDPAVKETTPPFIYRRAAAMNAAYCSYIARLLEDPTIAMPYRQAGFGQMGQELADPIWETRFADYRQDCADSDAWAKRFGLVDWFAWQLYPL